MLKFFKLKLF